MTTKQVSMRNKKQQKAKTRHKKPAYKKAQLKKPDDATLAYEVAKRGLVATAKKYRKVIDSGDLSQGPDHTMISQGFVTFIDVMAPIHSTVEVISILEKEGKVVLSEKDKEMINAFDEQVVKVCEDITAIGTFMEEGLEFAHFADLYVHYIELAAEMTNSTAKTLYETVIKPHTKLVVEYVNEHRLTGEKDMEFAMRAHDNRMKVIYPIYRTVVADVPAPEEDMEDELIPAGEVHDAELERDEEETPIKDVN